MDERDMEKTSCDPMSGEEFLRRTKMREIIDLPDFIEGLVIEVGQTVKYTIRAAAVSRDSKL